MDHLAVVAAAAGSWPFSDAARWMLLPGLGGPRRSPTGQPRSSRTSPSSDRITLAAGHHGSKDIKCRRIRSIARTRRAEPERVPQFSRHRVPRSAGWARGQSPRLAAVAISRTASPSTASTKGRLSGPPRLPCARRNQSAGPRPQHIVRDSPAHDRGRLRARPRMTRPWKSPGLQTGPSRRGWRRRRPAQGARAGRAGRSPPSSPG